MNASGTNIPAYTASPTSTGYGNVVTFTDESILNDDVGLTYLWDFGDTLTSTTGSNNARLRNLWCLHYQPDFDQ